MGDGPGFLSVTIGVDVEMTEDDEDQEEADDEEDDNEWMAWVEVPAQR